jgi:hypothetical protein
MNATREHLAGLELVIDEMHDMLDGSCEARLTRLIEQAQFAPEPVQGEAVAGLRAVIRDAHESYERFGADCMMEGIPMIAAAVLEEIHDAAAKPDWREHSRHIAKGEKCPETIETLQAAWDRDQELIEDQRKEIASLKQKLNQARQSKAKPDDDLVELLRDAFASYGNAIHWEDLHPVMKRIDAKLAELQK